jgi:hypothetical protein
MSYIHIRIRRIKSFTTLTPGRRGQLVQQLVDPALRPVAGTATVRRNPETEPTAPSTVARQRIAGANAKKTFFSSFTDTVAK